MLISLDREGGTVKLEAPASPQLAGPCCIKPSASTLQYPHLPREF